LPRCCSGVICRPGRSIWLTPPTPSDGPSDRAEHAGRGHPQGRARLTSCESLTNLISLDSRQEVGCLSALWFARASMRFHFDDHVRRYGKMDCRCRSPRAGDRREVQASRAFRVSDWTRGCRGRRDRASEQAGCFSGRCQGNAGFPADWSVLLLTLTPAPIAPLFCKTTEP
jgi:hypothetical protein